MKFTSKLQLAALLAIALALPLVYAKAPQLSSQEGPKTKKQTALSSARMAAFVATTGVEQDELGIWSFSDGTKVAWFKDPDGNILSLAQFKAEKVKSQE